MTTRRQRLLSSFGDFFVSLSPRVEANFLCVNFICNLTLKFLSGSTVGGRRTDVESETACEICRWLQVLPQLLCQWGGDFPENSAYVLQVLVEVAKRAPAPPSVCTSDRTGGVSSSNKGPVKTVGGVAAGGVSPSNRKGVIDSGGKGPGKYVTGSGAGAKSAISGTVSTPSAATAAARLPGSREGAIGGWAVESLELLNSIRPAVLREFFSEGAFLALPIEAQMDAISLLYHVPSISNGVLSALAAACSRLTAIHSDIRSFILEVRIRPGQKTASLLLIGLFYLCCLPRSPLWCPPHRFCFCVVSAQSNLLCNTGGTSSSSKFDTQRLPWFLGEHPDWSSWR